MKFCSCKGRCACANCSCGDYAQFFDTLGNQNRLHILDALRTEPQSVSQIIAKTGLEQTCVSHCLRKLEGIGAVTAARKGKFRIYALNRTAIEPLLKLLNRHVQPLEGGKEQRRAS